MRPKWASNWNIVKVKLGLVNGVDISQNELVVLQTDTRLRDRMKSKIEDNFDGIEVTGYSLSVPFYNEFYRRLTRGGKLPFAFVVDLMSTPEDNEYAGLEDICAFAKDLRRCVNGKSPQVVIFPYPIFAPNGSYRSPQEILEWSGINEKDRIAYKTGLDPLVRRVEEIRREYV